MKIFLQILLTGFFTITLFNLAQAQPGGGQFDPEKRAEMQTTLMADSLALSTKQTEKVRSIHQKYAKAMTEMRNQHSEGDWESMRSAMMQLREEQDKELKTILTTEQWDKWLKVREAQRSQWGGNRGGGREKKDKKS